MKKNKQNTEMLNETAVEQSRGQENLNAAEPKETKEHRIGSLRLAAIFVVLGLVTVIGFKSCKTDRAKPIYDYSYGEEPSTGHVAYEKGKTNIVNPKTKEVIVEDIDWSHYSSYYDDIPIVLFSKNGKRGFCNIETSQVIVEPTTYTKAWVFSDGLAGVEKNGYIGFVDTTGKVAIDFKYSYRGNPLSDFVFHNGHCVVADSSNRLGVIDTKGRWVVKPLYDHVELTKEYVIVCKDGEFKKQLDFEGHVMQDGIIDEIYELYYEVKYNDLETGEPKVGRAKNNNYYEYRVAGYSGLIDSKGNVITKPWYTNISGVTATLFKARLQDWSSTVLIDYKGNVVSNVR